MRTVELRRKIDRLRGRTRREGQNRRLRWELTTVAMSRRCDVGEEEEPVGLLSGRARSSRLHVLQLGEKRGGGAVRAR
jgi:hypothetical protein